ncbi:MAG: hypothetical protein K6G03_02595 [Lachnospiraceae bacterium]|nr:hypothetical protein [Lachnospiraceae bacterium]
MSGIKIENRVYDLETSEFLYQVEFTGVGGHCVNLRLSEKDICNPYYMASVARKYLGDLSIKSDVFKNFTEIVQRLVNGKELVYAYNSIGWYQLNGELVYRSSNVITKDGEKKGIYKGDFDISCTGSYAFLDTLFTEVNADYTKGLDQFFESVSSRYCYTEYLKHVNAVIEYRTLAIEAWLTKNKPKFKKLYTRFSEW